MKKKAINLAQTPIAFKRVLFAFLFFSVWAAPNVGANPSLSGEKVVEAQVLQDGKQTVIKGTVIDSNGEALIGVSVKVIGTSIGTATDFDGRYTINVPRVGSVLEFTYVGYTPKRVTVGSEATIDVLLEDDSQMLSTVVVTAPIGVQRPPKEIGYSVSSISAKQLTEAGTTNFGSALYGKAAGVKITTAPGGATSAVNIQIRGINSLNYDQQPLYVVDGVMIRNDGQAAGQGTNNGGFDGDQRIRGNGLLDINPLDIETMTILKGASASALYGSDAASGVVVITTKRGSKGQGLGVEVNWNGMVENVAFLPKYQTTYGPGYEPSINLANGATVDGWMYDENSKLNNGYRPYFRAYAQFGPKFEGQQVSWWDGSVGTYSGSDNFKDLFQTGYTSNLNIALAKQTDNLNYRLSYTRLDNSGTQRNSGVQKNTFNLNSVINLDKNVTLDVVANYINTNIKNRPYSTYNILGSNDGMFSRAEKVSTLLNNYKTSEGYKYVTYGASKGNPDDAFIYTIRATNTLDYLWERLRNSYDETENRLITSATLNWNVLDKLKFRGRIGNDFTAANIEGRGYTEYNQIYNSDGSTGRYEITKNQYSILYGDAMLTYSDKITPDFGFTLAGGFQGRQEEYKSQYSSTRNGLNVENWFSLSNSYGSVGTNSNTRELLKYAYIGVLNLSYKDMLFLESTARQEYSSTLPVDNNHYFYWSTNSSWVYSDAFKLPSWITYGKVRASYGIVGNSPVMYAANVAYTQTSLQASTGSVPAFTMKSTYGNLNLTAEMKHEWEFGLEKRFFDDRVSLDVSYYTNKVKDQIMNITVPLSSGATDQTVNVGEIGSKGLEIATSVTPFIGKFRWTTRLNWAFNSSKVNSLAPGINELQFASFDQGSIKISSVAGETLGNIYSFVPKKNDKGEFLISNEGFYIIDQTKYEKVGNIMPKVVGGWSNTFNYNNFSLDFTIDYRFGGQIVSPPTKYGTAAGLYESTMKYRDPENGGASWNYLATNGKQYSLTDGMVINGVNENTGLPNNVTISAAEFYRTTYQWGADGWNDGMVYDNDFIKFRELTLGYAVPDLYAKKIGLSGLRLSVFGRNLFYVWRSLENIDPEASIGSRWWSQGIDSGASPASRTFGFSVNAKF
ncbi:iron complex outermembrane receptor protein [Dysgonomonas alginatilytica]|uniref:Iron complex outermembrane receptor protein n=1 Tax=Dysgonomonas alginatilytica TaxID=1605892 RepID=A0A2V3PQ42_9BACT|nr:SusC/RagA family TonB-linked outer membrane protein [Dysgonomonas alginatilytica]PXV65058.1 iron complex outermembrane receptor protein [Dysgonomonas alginatilytica]